ncbi:hypothetical protein L248_1437 [Schleiferilactobacillus shenzhenensis LY-73]|uniref:Uncharacterized protein n=1 Tax=Schleiferilactobacillus shenzhenensis LY-73 TaxID=1231336 RepID=U4TJ66_9LACO|nr:hypothetical protein L248_1437 [Schleiferilactobacillus shenzhenensis LY-73]
MKLLLAALPLTTRPSFETMRFLHWFKVVPMAFQAPWAEDPNRRVNT